METLVMLLKEHPFFKDFPPPFISLLTECASNRVYKQGSFITRSGEEAREFYLIREGIVAIELDAGTDHPIVLQTLDNGDILGWSWLLPPYYWHFDTHVQKETHLYVLDGPCIRQKCEKNHSLGYELLKRFAYIMETRLEATRLQLLDIYQKNR